VRVFFIADWTTDNPDSLEAAQNEDSARMDLLVPIVFDLLAPCHPGVDPFSIHLAVVSPLATAGNNSRSHLRADPSALVSTRTTAAWSAK
jgi:hypothetical protein